MGKVLVVLLGVLLWSALADAGVAFTPVGDLRVRQEILDGVYHFAPEADRDWLRVRTRAGLRVEGGAHGGEVVLLNEHRHYFEPSGVDFDWDELVLDQVYWRWLAPTGMTVTLGRQNIVWPGGLLMLEGHPLDGSRSMYHHALRFQSRPGPRAFDLAVIRNPKRDPWVLAGDFDRALSDADERALAVRLIGERGALAVIVKSERDPDDVLPDLKTITLGIRREGSCACGTAWHGEVALQYQHGWAASVVGPLNGPANGWAAAGDVGYKMPVGGRWTLAAGAFYYSGPGASASWRAFRAPWGRWPKWSELYIYSLIGESTPGRVHVAAWENVAGSHATFTRPLGERLTASVGATWLLAPEPEWRARGLLTRAELKATLGARLQGHLLWEMLAPGSFHDGRHGLPPLLDTVHFLRWQLAWTL